MAETATSPSPNSLTEMSSSSAIGGSGEVSARRRSAFSRTCVLLGRFVKETKAAEIAGNVRRRGQNEASDCRTMSLFPVNDRAVNPPIPGNGSLSLSPQVKPDSSETKSAPMTIFYAGQVIVINDFPAHKAKEIMDLANQSISRNQNATQELILSNKPDRELSSSIVKDIPVSRRTSLHRFLEKRKDRITARAPYNKSEPGDTQSRSNPGESDSWLGLAAGPSSLRP